MDENESEGSYTGASSFSNENPYKKWEEFCTMYANPGSTQIQLWQFLLELLKVILLFKKYLFTIIFRLQSTSTV